MRANEQSINDILGGSRQYVIPVFQRYYEWADERWSSLWSDISALAQENDSNFTHFLGPIVVITNPYAFDIPRFMVIDGQQRLMTLTILLAAIRDRAKQLGYSALATSIDSNVLYSLATNGAKNFKIAPRIRDRETLQKVLDAHRHDIDVSHQLAKAYSYFYNEIDQITPTQSSLFDQPPDKVLDNLYKSIINRLSVVLIILGENDDPSNIYESLNFKHETLSDADLIRNYVFMQIKKAEEQETFDEAIWRPFESMFDDERETLTDFYYRYLIPLQI